MTEQTTQRGATRFQLEAVEGFFWAGVLLGCVAALLLVKCGSPLEVSLMEPQGRLWWAWLLAFHVTIALGVGLVVAAIATVARRPGLSRAVLQLVSAGILSVTVVMNRFCLGALISGGRTAESCWPTVGALSVALLATAAMAAGILWSRPNMVRGASLVVIVGCFLALPGLTSVGTADSSLQLPGAVSTTNQRLLVIGLDGADWDYLDPLMTRGDLPNLQSLKDTGIWGDLKTIRPTRSAPIWTSVVTGVEPGRHGIINNSVERLQGSYHRLPNTLALPRGLGVAQLENLLRRWGRISPSSVASFDRRVPALWNIATRNDSPMDLVNWWASWPVEQVRGHIVSDRTHFWRSQAKGHSVDRGFVTYPDSLLVDLSPLILRPDQVTREDALQFMEVSIEEFEEMKTTPYRHHKLKSEFKYLYSMFVSNVRISLHLMDRGRSEIGQPSDQFVLLRIIDQASHQALGYSDLVENHLRNSPAEVEKYSRVVTEVYRAADRAIGQLVERFGEGNVMVLSDHGFKLLRPRTRNATYGHFGASKPDGMIIAAGPAFRRGPVEGLGIYDMMPLFLALKGWPIAKDLVRGVPMGVFKESFLAQHPVETIESYGTMRVDLPADGPIVADDEMVERLRALGYLD